MLTLAGLDVSGRLGGGVSTIKFGLRMRSRGELCEPASSTALSLASTLAGAGSTSVASTASSVSANSVPTSEDMGDGATPGVEGDFRLFTSDAGALSESLAVDLRGRVS